MVHVRGARVLEAGCGAGLPGAFALRHKCANLVLTDFNEEGLRWLTMPTLRLLALLILGDLARSHRS